jgi:hypothetical protein
MPSMKKGNSDVDRSDLDRNNIIKSIFDTLTEEDRKVIKVYHAILYPGYRRSPVTT